MNNKLLAIILACIISSGVYAQSIFYIDPSSKETGIQNGSIDNPFHSWSEIIAMKDGDTYLQKRGTTDKTGSIIIRADNITIGAYGTGARPVIHSLAVDKEHAIVSWKQNHLTIKNIEVYAPTATSCIYFNKYNNDNIIDSCVVHGSTWGIRITSGFNHDHKILNTEVFDTKDDGIFIQDTKNVEIAGCYIHDVNKNWKSPETTEQEAGGDGIQLSRSTEWYIHHNKIDRSSTGNKFCIIAKETTQKDCVIEYNHFIAPKINGTCIYFSEGSDLVIRYNTFEGNDKVRGIYHHSSGLLIYYNIFNNFEDAIVSLNPDPCKIYNNVFNNVIHMIRGTNIIARNNIYNLRNSSQVVYYKMGMLEESNNHYSTGKPGNNSTTGDPVFVNTEKGDFRLKPSSPCINKGVNLGLKQDFYGNTLKADDIPDIGVCEYK